MCISHCASEVTFQSFPSAVAVVMLGLFLPFTPGDLCLPLDFLRSLPFSSDPLHSYLMHDVWTATFCLPIRRQADDD